MSFFTSVFDSFRNFLEVSTAPFAIRMKSPEAITKDTKERKVISLHCSYHRMIGYTHCADKGEVFWITLHTVCTTEDGLFYCEEPPKPDAKPSKPRNVDSLTEFSFYDANEDSSSDESEPVQPPAAKPLAEVFGCAFEREEEFYERFPDTARSQLYFRKLSAQQMLPLTKEMCAKNPAAVGFINDLLSLPQSIYSKQELQIFKKSVAGLQKVIDTWFEPGAAAALATQEDWEERCEENDVEHKAKKRKKKQAGDKD